MGDDVGPSVGDGPGADDAVVVGFGGGVGRAWVGVDDGAGFHVVGGDDVEVGLCVDAGDAGLDPCFVMPGLSQAASRAAAVTRISAAQARTRSAITRSCCRGARS